jgi:drug/metabolite transporter (DMT)-like permease
VATIPPLTLIAARTLLAGALLLGWILARRVRLPRDLAVWRRMLLQAMLNSVLPFTLIAWAEQSVDAGVATMLNSVSPVLTFLAACLITRQERFTPWKAFGVALGLAGVCLVVGPAAWGDVGGPLLPELAILVATVCYSGAALYGRSFRALPPAVPAAGSMILGAALLAPAALVIDTPWLLRPSAASIEALLALAAFSTALAFVIYFRLVRTIGSVATTAQAYLRVPIGVGLGMAFLGESLNPAGWAGLVCVVVGVAAMTLGTGRGRYGPTGDAGGRERPDAEGRRPR